jgi:superfamily II DNA or RNA helicase
MRRWNCSGACIAAVAAPSLRLLLKAGAAPDMNKGVILFVRTARNVFGRIEDFVRKITGNKERGPAAAADREFRNRPQPSIVVTVDILSTGVDIPDLEFIVFLRLVKFRILFEQMLGRGTRRERISPLAIASDGSPVS